MSSTDSFATEAGIIASMQSADVRMAGRLASTVGLRENARMGRPFGPPSSAAVRAPETRAGVKLVAARKKATPME